MSTFSFDHGDDLSDFLGGERVVSAAPKSVPQGEEFARIRAMDGAAPVAKTFKVPCSKCRGSGRFVGYTGRPLGPCFACKGAGSFERKSSATQLAANRQKAADRKIKAARGNWEAFVEQFPAEAKVLTDGMAQTWGDGRWQATCADIKGKVERYGDLHEGTMAMLGRAAERAAQKAAQKAQETVQRQQQVAGVNVANLVDVFQRANAAGLKRFSLRFVDLHMAMDRNDHDKVWVSKTGYGSARYGVLKVSEGRFYPGRDFTAEVAAKMELVSADPMAAAKAYTQVTSSCSVCGLHLENEVSVEQGMGPICSGRLTYKPGGKYVEVKPGDF